METAATLKFLQDPMGVPFYPVVFQALMVLTFSLHIVFVNLTLGTIFLAVLGRLKTGERWGRLASAMAQCSTVNISLAILLGVAPLLFVQVIYDPFWYASNNLSAAWVIGFVFIMMAGYSATYLFLSGEKTRKRNTLFGATAFVLFLLAGFIMHVLGFQALQPEKWLGWYTSHGAAATAGTVLHDFSLPRFLHFIIPAFAVTGVFLMLYAWYFRVRPDIDRAYLDWAGRLGAKMAFHATTAEILTGLLWLLVIPGELRFYANPFLHAGLLLGFALLGLLFMAQRSDDAAQRLAIPAAAATFVTILEMSAAREALRMAYLKRFDYSPFSHHLNLDWPSTALFFGTFALCLSVLAYLLTVVFSAGRVAGRFEAGPRLQSWGRVSIGLLAAWIVVVVGLGVAVTLRH